MSEKKNVTNENQGNSNPVDEVKKDKKPNIFVRIGRKIGNGVRAVRESPVATAIGAIGGAIVTGAGVLVFNHMRNRGEEETEMEPIEQEFEEEECESEPEEEVQDETAA